MDGESRSQQWQVQSPAASASISLLPLVLKRVWISDVQAIDIDYRQRPRLKPDKDYSDTLPFFPDIGAREISAIAEPDTRKKSPWHIEVEGIKASGRHQFWIFGLRGTARGELAGGLTVETRGGPFSLNLPEVNLALEPLIIKGDKEVLSGGTLQGMFGFAPFVPRENKGVALLSYLRTDVQADIAMNDLSFLDLFLLKVQGVTVDGRGQVTGRLVFHRGQVLEPTRLEIDARELDVHALSHVIGGEGKVTLAMDDARLGEGLYLGFDYHDLSVARSGGPQGLLIGEGLGLAVRSNGYVLPEGAGRNSPGSVELTVESLRVPDLVQIRHYLPPQLPLQIHGGRGALDGRVLLRPTALDMELSLTSNDADLSLQEYRFASDLDFVLNIHNPDIASQATSVGGSYLHLFNSRLQRGEHGSSGEWNTRFDIDSGRVSLSGDPATSSVGQVGDLLQTLGEADASERLSQVWAELELSASMSNLAWIEALIHSDHGIGIAGSGDLQGELHVDKGKLVPPSSLAVRSDDLSVAVLDYVSRGNGSVGLTVDKGPPGPLWSLSVALQDADLKRQSDEVSHIENVELSLAAQMTTSEEEDKPLQARELDFRIASARVTDMAAFNSYLPQDGSIAFAGGSADLAADIQLKPTEAVGWLTLDASDASALVADQAISGDVALDVRLAGGVPQDMAFDISGSTLLLDNVRVAGDRSEFQDEHWSARFLLERGQAVWRKPVRLRAEGALAISDTRPFVTVFENGGWRPGFLSRMLTIEDIQGRAALSIADEVIYIEDARVEGDKLEVAARGTLSRDSRNSMLYLRYKKLDGVLKYQGQDRNLDIINARKTFDGFRPPLSPLADSPK